MNSLASFAKSLAHFVVNGFEENKIMQIKVKQRDITDCGAACLASVAAYYNLTLPVARIRQFAGTDKKGTNVLGLVEAAGKIGFLAKGVRGEWDSLFKIPRSILK